MAITSAWASATDPRVVIDCKCKRLSITSATPYNGTALASGAESIAPAETGADRLAQLEIMREAVADGDADVYYNDDSAGLIAFADLPRPYAVMHMLHQFHPPGFAGGLALAEMILNGDYGILEGVRQYSFRGHLRTQRLKPTESAIDFPLRQWEAIPSIVTAGEFRIEVPIPVQLKILAADLDSHAPIMAMREELEANRDDGTAFGTDFSEQASWENRNVTVTFGDGTTLTFSYDSLSHTTETVDGTAYYTSFGLVLTVDSGGSYDVNKLNALLATSERSISTTGIKVDGPIGDYESPAQVREVDFGNGRRIAVEEGSFVHYVRDGDGDHAVGVVLGNTRMISLAELVDDGLANKYVPASSDRPLAHIIRISDQTTALDINIDSYQGLAKKVNNAFPFEIHNHNTGAAGLVHLLNPAGGNIVSLQPGQHGEFVSTFNPDGTGRLIGHLSAERRAIFAGTESQGTFSGPYVSLDAAYWGRLISLDDDGRIIDGDAFSIGSSSFSNGIAVASAMAVDNENFLNILKLGHCRFIQEFQLQTAPGATGSWGAGHGIDLWRYRAGTAEEIHSVEWQEFNPVIGVRTYRFRYEDDVEVDDRYGFFFRYPKNPTLGPGNVQVAAHYRACFLDQTINLIHTPS